MDLCLVCTNQKVLRMKKEINCYEGAQKITEAPEGKTRNI